MFNRMKPNRKPTSWYETLCDTLTTYTVNLTIENNVYSQPLKFFL